MKATSDGIEEKVDELLACLDKDIQHIEQNLSQLNELRSLVIKREDVALGKLLESIRAGEESYRNHELYRQSIRKELAIAFDYNTEQMTLSVLEATLPKAKRAQISQMKTKLRSLIEECKKEYLSTTLLLSECARFNNMLLKSIFDIGRTETVYYNSNGAARRQSEMAFVNLQF